MVRISTAQFRDLLDFYGADAETKDEVLGRLQEIWSAKGQTSSGWWRAYADVVNPHFDHFMSLEQACSRLTAFTLTLLPGLLQTPAYRRAVVAVNDPDMAVVDVERRLELTARRQRRLTDDPGFSVEVLLSEAALRHQVGGQASMARQLRHLMEIGSLPNVCVRAVPFGVEMHPGVEHLQPGGGDCVEVAYLDEYTVGVRDSKNRTGPTSSSPPPNGTPSPPPSTGDSTTQPPDESEPHRFESFWGSTARLHSRSTAHVIVRGGR
ncbi:DUF397 domain-containing protein [Nocardia africana]|uniref:Domain of uncharacterized function (DUF397) n=1 Tax=Nocardia africana TaxID=134964 RepID=A0A378WIV6_9NOCA|nr:DUF397 domain-containing protein [Nocardia africana]SUA41220.1 Domain of uncharacterised function (DUF397) [Nocardia africana]